MVKIVVVTDIDSAAGFRLAGVDVVTATSENAEETLQTLVKTPEVGMIAVNETLLEALSERTKKVLRMTDFPLVISFPKILASKEKGKAGEGYAAELIRKAIGYHIKL